MIKILATIFEKLKNLLTLSAGLFLWLAPLALFLAVTYLPKLLWNLSFKEYLEFLGVLVWPYTLLVILFFFKRVVTYLFFSMEGFDFFGAKGGLKNVEEVILEEVNKRFLEEKKEADRRDSVEKLNKEINEKEAEIKKKENQINSAKGEADENLELAKEILKDWKKSTTQNTKTISDLNTENRKLKEIISNLSKTTTADNLSKEDIDTSKTSNPILDETSIKE
jgi:hypothetical protein